MTPVVFIHTNAKQLLGAKVSEYSMRRNSTRASHFDIRYIHIEQHPALNDRHGQNYLRKGKSITWDKDDLQSFTPARFLAPQLMDYQGRAVVIDPDVFAVGDVYELLSRDMQGKAIACRKIAFPDGRPYYATSVMLLECAKLRHWDWERDVQRMFNHQLDYHDWMNLYSEPEDNIDLLEEEWNHFDTLNEHTRLLHNTVRITQPWKTGLTIDFVKHAVDPTKRASGVYQPHPDKRQEQFFFGLLRECVEQGVVSEDFIRSEMTKRQVRRDALEVIDALAPIKAGNL